MNITISQETRNRTTKCLKEFQCLTDPSHAICPATRALEGDGVFIKWQGEVNCPYKMLFGQAFICNCPTRRELYLLHNL